MLCHQKRIYYFAKMFCFIYRNQPCISSYTRNKRHYIRDALYVLETPLSVSKTTETYYKLPMVMVGYLITCHSVYLCLYADCSVLRSQYVFQEFTKVLLLMLWSCDILATVVNLGESRAFISAKVKDVQTVVVPPCPQAILGSLCRPCVFPT